MARPRYGEEGAYAPPETVLCTARNTLTPETVFFVDDDQPDREEPFVHMLPDAAFHDILFEPFALPGQGREIHLIRMHGEGAPVPALGGGVVLELRLTDQLDNAPVTDILLAVDAVDDIARAIPLLGPCVVIERRQPSIRAEKRQGFAVVIGYEVGQDEINKALTGLCF